MSFIRNNYDSFPDNFPAVKLIGTFYNFQDLLASKDSREENIDGRLEFLKNQVFKRMINEEIILWEPFYEIIQENYPEVKIGKTLYNRIYEDFLPKIEEIRLKGKNVDETIKQAVISFSKTNQVRKIKQIKDFKKYSAEFKKQIIAEGGDINSLEIWKNKVEILLKNLIYKYSTTGGYLPSNFDPDMNNFSIESCELFVGVMAKFLQNEESDLTPGLNDNIDLLTLLYVRNGRKLLMRDDKWTDTINEIGFGEKYLHPFE